MYNSANLLRLDPKLLFALSTDVITVLEKPHSHLTLCLLGNFWHLLIFPPKSTVSKSSLRNTFRVSTSLDHNLGSKLFAKVINRRHS